MHYQQNSLLDRAVTLIPSAETRHNQLEAYWYTENSNLVCRWRTTNPQRFGSWIYRASE